jgi:hypothetical protein
MVTNKHISSKTTDQVTNPKKQNHHFKANHSSAGQEIPRIFGTRKFITALARASHLFLSSARSFQSTPSHQYILAVHVIMIRWSDASLSKRKTGFNAKHIYA